MRNTFCEISLSALRSNLLVIQKFCGPTVRVCAVVKANAYGHGLVRVAQELDKAGADYLAVAIADEGVLLRKNGIIKPILVMATVDENDIKMSLEHDLTLTASSIKKLELIAELGEKQHKTPRVHLKIDTGMGRIGVHWDRTAEFLRQTKKLISEKKIICEGIYTHFADSLHQKYTQLQFERFQKVLKNAAELGLSFELTHACSSRSIFMYPEFHLDMVRPGIALYGVEPEYTQKILPQTICPVLSWKTKIVYFKVVMQDEYVGYGRTWSPIEKYARIVTLPLGYADGFPRRLSNKGLVIIRGKECPVVGRVCMDQTMVSLGEQGTAYVDDEVVLIGSQQSEKITVEMIAEILETAPHEITTSISERVPRIYID